MIPNHLHHKIACLLFIAVAYLPSISIYAQELEKEIPLDPKVVYGKLDNGLTYYIRQNEKPENRVQLRLVVNAGSMQEDEDQLGLAHFTEHMLFNGTENFEKNDIVNFLQSLGVEFGADLNAYTSFDETVYMLPLPSDDPEVLDNGFQILDDWAHSALFDPEEIEKERGVVLEEWRTGLGASERIRKQTLPVILKDSRYKDRLPIGDTAIIKNFEPETIVRFYEDWYRPRLMAIVVVGDIDVAEMETKIKTQFGDILARENPRKKEEYGVPSHDETLIVTATDVEQPFTQIQILHKHPKKNVETFEDYRELLSYRLYNEMLNARMEELSQQADPPFIYGGSSYGGFLGDKDVYQASAAVNENGIERGLTTLLRENKRVLEHGFLPSELERAKKNMLNRYERSYNERNKTQSARYVSEYISHFLDDEPTPGIEVEYEFVKEQLPGIELAAINQLAKEWITDKNRVVVITGPDKEEVKLPSEEEVRTILQEMEDSEVEPYEDKVIEEPLIAEMPTPGTIEAEKKLESVGATELTLSNGIKVILKPTDFKDDEILMTAFSFGGSSLLDDDTYRSANYADGIVQESGVRNFSQTDLQKLMAGKTVSVSPYIDQLDEGFSGSATPKDLESLFQLTHLYFTAPRKDEEVFSSFISKNKSILQNIMSNPGFYFQDKVIEVLTQDHPRAGGIPTPEELDEVELDKAMEIYGERFADASDFVFFFVGNFDVDTIKPYLETYLASLPDIDREETFRDLGIRPPQEGVKKTFIKGTEPKSQVRIVFTGDLEEEEDRFHLNAMAEALSIKLIENLREEISGIYGTRASSSTSKYPYPSYSVNISFTCAPENVDTLVRATQIEIDKIKENGPTDEDLQKVREQKLNNLEENIKENSYWLQGLQMMYYEDKPTERITEASVRERIENLTKADIQEVAKQYMDYDKMIVLTLNPEEVEATETIQAPVDITAEQVIANYLEAIGGKDRLQEIKTYQSQMKMNVMGMEIDIIEARKAPDKYMMKQTMPQQGEMIQIYNGGNVTVKTPQGTQELPPEAAEGMKYEAEAMFRELSYREMGLSVELQGVENVEEKPAYKLQYTLPIGDTETRWYDQESGLLLKVENAQQSAVYTEYKEIDGIQFPVKAKLKAQGMDMEMTVDEVQVNPELEDSMFEMR